MTTPFQLDHTGQLVLQFLDEHGIMQMLHAVEGGNVGGEVVHCDTKVDKRVQLFNLDGGEFLDFSD